MNITNNTLNNWELNKHKTYRLINPWRLFNRWQQISAKPPGHSWIGVETKAQMPLCFYPVHAHIPIHHPHPRQPQQPPLLTPCSRFEWWKVGGLCSWHGEVIVAGAFALPPTGSTRHSCHCASRSITRPWHSCHPCAYNYCIGSFQGDMRQLYNPK
jgi:hypothetical protein